MRNMATESEIGRATPKNLPLGDTLMPSGASPTKKGEPMGVSAPFDPTLNAEMSPDPAFPAYTNLPLGVTANEMPRKKPPDPPVANGESGTGVKAPVVVLIEKPLMSLLPVLAT